MVQDAVKQGITHFAFGDLFLADIRAYRETQLAGSGLQPLFPLWGSAAATKSLATGMIAAGLRATLTCVDPRQLDARFAGRAFDATFLAELPDTVDPCGEQGEFHTFCHAGPMFKWAIPVRATEIFERDGFCYTDLVLA